MDSTRKKSCNACRAAKTRCNLSLPTCSRCQKRNIKCVYDHQNFGRHASPLGQDAMFHSWLMGTEGSTTPIVNDESPVGRSMASPSKRNSEMPEVPVSGTPSNGIYQPDMNWGFNSAFLSMPELPTIGDVSQEMLDQVIDPSQFAAGDVRWLERSASRSVQGAGESSNQREVAAITAAEGPDLLTALSFAMKESEQNISATWNALQSFKCLPNILERKETANVSDRLKESFVWSKIVSYATDFASAILPPFIHQMYLLKNHGGGNHDFANLPEPLANCRSIVPMYLQRNSSCKTLALKTVFLEVQRLHNEFQDYNDALQLCTLQALTMYVIVLAADTSDVCNVLRAVTRIAMGEVANAVQNSGYSCAAEERGNFPTWIEWAYQESKRRSLIVLHLIDRLVSMNLACELPKSCVLFDGIPLPCAKSMWLAKTELVWEGEYKRYMSVRHGCKSPTVGDLRRAADAAGTTDSDPVRDLSNWSKGVDDFGSLLLFVV